MATTIIAKIAARAKVIRKGNPRLSWQDAIKKASKELKGRSTKSKVITRKKTTRRVGIVSKTKKGKPRKRLSKAEKEYNAMADMYKYFVVEAATGKIASGWEYKEDAKDALSDYGKGEAKIYTLSQLKKEGKSDPRSKWKYKLAGTHKDTKSHNVNIRVVSGTKVKIPKASVDMDALNGIIKWEPGKYYEIVKGAKKGSVFKITSKAKHDDETKQLCYNANYYVYQHGHLQKPFTARIPLKWFDRHSIKPRTAVKPHELKKYT